MPGDLHQSVTDMDFADDLPEDAEEERFRKHNRFLRSLKDDTLIIIDNFNATATQDSFLSVMLNTAAGFFLQQEANSIVTVPCT